MTKYQRSVFNGVMVAVLSWAVQVVLQGVQNVNFRETFYPALITGVVYSFVYYFFIANKEIK
jgi:hypothetical protein